MNCLECVQLQKIATATLVKGWAEVKVKYYCPIKDDERFVRNLEDSISGAPTECDGK